MSVGVLGRTIAAPAADAARVAAIRNNLDLNDAGEIAAFGERACRDVAASVERIAVEVRNGDLAEALDVLAKAREAISRLDPSELEPRGGLDSLFNGRTARLHRFRKAYDSAGASVQADAVAVDERRQQVERRIGVLNGLHEHARSFILELDAYLEAGRQRLAAARAAAPAAEVVTPPEPGSAADDDAPPAGGEPADGPAPVADTAPAPVARALPDPSAVARLEARLERLEQTRAAALQQLPLIRVAQNADGFALDDLALGAAALVEWGRTWSGLINVGFGRERNRHRPSIPQLAEAKLAVLEQTERASRGLQAARERRRVAEDGLAKTADAVRVS